MTQTARLTALLLVVVSLFSSLFCPAQQPEARLAGKITGTSRAVLANSRTPRVERGLDRGAVPPGMGVAGITLVFKRTTAQQNALEELLAAQQNPASPQYHRWLTPDSFATRFGTADADIAASEAWLQSQGFQVESVGRGRDRITFSGTAAQVQAAFGAELRRYEVDGEMHFAPASDLMLPAALAPITAAVLHLSDFRPKPSIVAQSSLQPAFTAASNQAHYLTPKDVLTMYGLTSPAIPMYRGSGQGLVIVGQSYINSGSSSAIQQFQVQMSNSSNGFTNVLVPGSGVEAVSPGDQGESELDAEYAAGIAQNANIYLVYVGANKNYSVFDAIDFAITANIAPVISISYGACESLLSATELDQDNALFQQAAAQGQTLVASSGDSGSTSCAQYPVSSGVTLAQQQALAVTFPASSPYVVAVGGTQMAAGTFAAGPSTYWSSTSPTTGDTVNTLLSYVPEVVWNEGSAARGIIAGGGGTSGHFPRPSWQNMAPGISAGAYRLVPDIALQSSIQAPGFLLCTGDRLLSGGQTSCTSGLRGSNNQYTVAGGTSFAAPVFAGMVAILNQIQQTNGQGNINPTLYRVASDPAAYAKVFHDITSGSIACVAGATACGAPGQAGYAATPGYDQATGLGSFDFSKLLASWPASSTATKMGTNTLVVLNQYTAVAGSSVPVQITVGTFYAGNGTTAPTGSLSVSVDGAVIQPAVSLSNASPLNSSTTASLSFTAPVLTGSHVITVAYSGDSTHAPSAGTGSVLVGAVVPSGSFTLAANNLVVANGSSGTDQVTITPANGYSGRLMWALSVTGGNGGGLTGCYGIGSPAVNGPSTATLTIGVGAACGSSSSSGSSVRTFVSQTAPSKEEEPWQSARRMTVYAGLLLFGLCGLRKQRVPIGNLVALAVFAAVAAGLAGCGGSSSNGVTGGATTTPPVAAATVYTMTLNATDSVSTSIMGSTTFTLTVQ